MLRRQSTVTIHAPRDLIVMLGCNDLPRAGDKRADLRTPPSEYEANLDALLGQIKGRSSLLITSFPVSPEKTGIDPATFDQYMAIARAAATRHGYAIWDLQAELRDKAEPFWAPDGLHFNDAGHRAIAETLAARLLVG
jgi:lysophospholipase L1-like esterase